jgi:hypothetical protein
MNYIIFKTILILLFFTAPAYSYIDPGVLTFIWQAIILVLTSALLFLTHIKDKIYFFFINLKKFFKKKNN